MDVPRPAPTTPIAERFRAWLAWFGVGKLVTTAGSMLIIASGSWWLLHAPPPPVERSLPYAAGAGSLAPSTVVAAQSGGAQALADVSTSTAVVVTVPSTIIVQVAGAVLYPGVFTLATGARIHQLIEAAGGATAEGDPGALNLAVALNDGDRVFVPRLGDATEPPVVAANAGSSTAPRATAPGAMGSGGGTPTAAGPIDLNRATPAELDALPGVGPATATAIVSFRDEHGPFAAVDDLLDVRGIGPAKLDAIRPMVTV